MTITKNQRNSEGKPHGYWEVYYSNGKLRYKGNYINGNCDGYWEEYYNNGQIWYKGNLVNGNFDGYWEWYSYDGKLIETIFYDRN